MMILIFILAFSFHNNDASLQFFKDMWSKTRLCIGEGGYCPLHLPLKSSGCCKPYVCEKVPTTHKPTVFARLADTKCVLPSNITHSSTTMNYHGIEEEHIVASSNKTEESKLENVSENWHSIGTNNSLEGNETVNQYSDSQYQNYNSSEALSKENYHKNVVYNDNNEQEDEDTNVLSLSPDDESDNPDSKAIAKRGRPFVDVNNNSAIENKTLENRTDYSSVHNSSLEYSESLYSESSNSSDYSNEYKDNNATSAKYTDNVDMEVNQIDNVTVVESNLHFNNTSAQNISGEEVDDDWTSSEMDFDRRPFLHKVVTILPFHFFSSVQVNRINESIETSE